MEATQEYTAATPEEQFNSMLKKMLPEILQRESDNSSAIHLYRTCGYWTAFEKSAFQLSLSGMPHDTAAMQFATIPHPIIMAYIDDVSLALLQQTCNTLHDGNKYKTIAASPLHNDSYDEWRREETEIFDE